MISRMRSVRVGGASVAVALVALCSCRGNGRSTGGELEVRTSALTQASVWGFETLWTTSAGTASLSTVHDQGQDSLQLEGFTYTEVTSPPVAVAATSANAVGFDLWIPTPPANVFWFGGAEVFLTCPAQGIYHAFVGYQDLLPFPQATFATVAMGLPSGLQALFQAGCSNLQVGIALSVAGGSPYRLDNFQLNPLLNPPAVSILGMERTLDWSPTAGNLVGTSVRTQGLQALLATGFTYTEIRGAPVRIDGLSSNQIGFDLMVQAQPPGTWPGQAELFLSAPSKGVNHSYVGQVPLDAFLSDRFQTAAFAIPDSLFQALQGTVTDLSVGIVLNVASANSGYRIDNVRFGPGQDSCPLSDAFAQAPMSANWQIYDTATPAGAVTTGPGQVTLATKGRGFATGGDSILFFYQATSGDLDASLSVDPPSPSGAAAGLLLRSGLFPTAPFVFVGLRSGRIAFITRTSDGAPVTTIGASVSGTTRLRLTKNGLNVSAYTTADGLTWTAVGSATLPYDGEVKVGPAAVSTSAGSQATASFHSFQILFSGGCGRCGDGG